MFGGDGASTAYLGNYAAVEQCNATKACTLYVMGVNPARY